MSDKVEIVVGPMSSGKTTEVSRRLERHKIAKKSIIVFKPTIDDRFGSDVVTDRKRRFTFKAHNLPQELSMEDIKSVLSMTEKFDVVGIDEVQFFNQNIVLLVQLLRENGKKVLLGGLDMDFKGQPFGYIGSLMAIACNVTKLHAVCTCCGEDAIFSQKLINGQPAPEGEVVEVGDVSSEEEEEKPSTTYEARCFNCFVPPHKVK